MVYYGDEYAYQLLTIMEKSDCQCMQSAHHPRATVKAHPSTLHRPRPYKMLASIVIRGKRASARDAPTFQRHYEV